MITIIINIELPIAMDYLNKVVPDDGFMVGDFSIADIAIGSMLLNAKYAQWKVDVDRWPAFAAYVGRVHDCKVFQKRMASEAKLLTI